MDDRIEIILSIGIIIVGSFIVSMFGGFSLSEEVRWYESNGYIVMELGYDEFLSTISQDVQLVEHIVPRKGVRNQSELYTSNSNVIIHYDIHKKIVYFKAQWSSESKRALIFIWRASIP